LVAFTQTTIMNPKRMKLRAAAFTSEIVVLRIGRGAEAVMALVTAVSR